MVDMVMSVAETLVANYGVKQVIIIEIFPNFNHDAMLYYSALKKQLETHSRTHSPSSRMNGIYLMTYSSMQPAAESLCL